MRLRSLWKAVPLEQVKDIWPRAIFRLLWCSVGGAITLFVFNRVHEPIPFVRQVAVLVCVIAGIGVLADAFRLLLRGRQTS